VFENRVLRRICGPKRGGEMGSWRKLHSKELHNIYFSKYNQNDQVKEDVMERACSMNGGEKEHI
jgi:hypothetical protein